MPPSAELVSGELKFPEMGCGSDFAGGSLGEYGLASGVSGASYAMPSYGSTDETGRDSGAGGAEA